jgi:hypothetical protein
MGGREQQGERGHSSGAHAARSHFGPELSAEEKARDEKEHADKEASAGSALADYEKDPSAAPDKQDRHRLKFTQGARLEAADAKAGQAKAASDEQDKAAGAEQQHRNTEQAGEIVRNLRAAIERATAGLLGACREARVAGHLPESAQKHIMEAVFQAVASGLSGAAKDPDVARVIHTCCALGLKGENIDVLPAELRSLAGRLERNLGDKAGAAPGVAFASVPAADELAAVMEARGTAALSAALGDKAKSPAKDQAGGAGTADDHPDAPKSSSAKHASQDHAHAHQHGGGGHKHAARGAAHAGDKAAAAPAGGHGHEPHEKISAGSAAHKLDAKGGSSLKYMHEVLDFFRIQTLAEKDAHLELKAHRDEHPVVGGISEGIATVSTNLNEVEEAKHAGMHGKPYKPESLGKRVQMPDTSMWDLVFAKLNEASSCLEADEPDIEKAKQHLKAAAEAFQEAHRKFYKYKTDTEEGAATAANILRGIEVGCEIIVTVLSAGAGGASLAGLGVRGVFKLAAEGAAKGLGKMAIRAAIAGGANKLAQEAAEQTVAYDIGLEDHIDWGKVLRAGATAAATNLFGVLVGGALSKLFMRTIGEILGARMAPESLLALAEKLGEKGPIPPELFVSKGWKWIAGLLADAGTTTLTTALLVTLEAIQSGGKKPTKEQFVRMVIEQLVQNGFIQLILGAITHGGPKSSGKRDGSGGDHGGDQHAVRGDKHQVDREATHNQQHRHEHAQHDDAAPAKRKDAKHEAETESKDPHGAHKEAPEKPQEHEAKSEKKSPANQGAGNQHEYRLSGDEAGVLSLSPGQEDQWPQQVAQFLASELHMDPAKVQVKQLNSPKEGEGRSGDPVFGVNLGGEEVGVFKVFKNPAEAKNEVNMLRLLLSKNMKKYNVVDERGQAGVEMGGQPKGGVMMETAQGTSINKQIHAIPPPGQAGHEEAVAELLKSTRSVAEAMAEMHGAFASGGPESLAQKQSDAGHILDEQLPKIKSATSPADYAAIDAKLRGEVAPAFIKSPVPATAYHGDANAGNFMVDKDYNVRVIDVGSMKWSVDAAGKGKSTGAADVGRFMQSLEASNTGTLTAAEMGHVQKSFMDTYLGASGVAKADFEPGVLLFRAQLEMAAIRFAKSPAEANAAVQRLGQLLGLPLSGSGGGQ